jgi:hypothetical protein
VSCPRPGATPSAAANKTVYTVGLNWYPNSNLRFLFDYLHGKLDNRFSSAAGGGIAGTPLGTPGRRRVRCRRHAHADSRSEPFHEQIDSVATVIDAAATGADRVR